MASDWIYEINMIVKSYIWFNSNIKIHNKCVYQIDDLINPDTTQLSHGKVGQYISH